MLGLQFRVWKFMFFQFSLVSHGQSHSSLVSGLIPSKLTTPWRITALITSRQAADDRGPVCFHAATTPVKAITNESHLLCNVIDFFCGQWVGYEAITQKTMEYSQFQRVPLRVQNTMADLSIRRSVRARGLIHRHTGTMKNTIMYTHHGVQPFNLTPLNMCMYVFIHNM